MTTISDDDIQTPDLQTPLTFALRFIYSVAIPNTLLWAGLAYYSYRPKLWKELRDHVFYDGPAASPDPLTFYFLTGATVLFLFIAISFLLLAFLLTMIAASYPWQNWYTSLGAGVCAVLVAATPIGAAWIYFF